MNSNTSEQIYVGLDPKDLQCGICMQEYAPQTREPLIISSCGPPVCSFCFPNLEKCTSCRGKIFQDPIKNLQLLSIVERYHQVKRCSAHKQPLKAFCMKENKLLCSECIEEKHPNLYVPIEEIESRLKETRSSQERIHLKKEESKKNLEKQLQECSLNLKRKLDVFYDERLEHDLSSKKKFKRMIDTFIFSEKDHCEHQLLNRGLSEYEETTKILQENWRKDNPEGSIVAQIFEVSSMPEQAIQFYTDRAIQISKDLAEKEKNIEKMIVELKNDLSTRSEYLLATAKAKFENLCLNNRDFNPNRYPEIAKNYLFSAFEEHGLVVKYQEKEDCIELHGSNPIPMLQNFDPKLFECSIEKLRFSCLSVSDSELQVLFDMLQNTQGLSHLVFSLKEASSKKIEALSDFILESKTLQKFSFDMPLCNETQKASEEYIKSLLNSKRISGFRADFTPQSVRTKFQQDLVLPPDQATKAMKKFSAKFIGENSLYYEQVILMMICALGKMQGPDRLIPLESIKLHFGSQTSSAVFIRNLYDMFDQSPNLQELDLGFAKVSLLQNDEIGEFISLLIRYCRGLRKVNLFLAGREHANDVFADCFNIDSENVPVAAGHKLEEFSLTIMRCDDVDIKSLMKFLRNFSQLKKLTVSINRVNIKFEKIIVFLGKIRKLKSLKSFDFACRDFLPLTDDDKKDLDACKSWLGLYNIRTKIVFEPLRPDHLPDYVDFISEEDEEQEQEEREAYQN